MKKILLVSVFTGMMAFPAFAQMADDMSCADFLALDADGRMKAIDAMADDSMMPEDTTADDMSEDSMASDDMTEDEMMGVSIEAVAAVCKDNPDMMLHDAIMESEAN